MAMPELANKAIARDFNPPIHQGILVISRYINDKLIAKILHFFDKAVSFSTN
jgi:hypothetical protein